ncbi:MAG: HU family DNA-binding protein [Desulfobacterales bacterium]|nr:HU family DNA-binding protein [Desulfobacterales bacterium]
METVQGATAGNRRLALNGYAARVDTRLAPKKGSKSRNPQAAETITLPARKVVTFNFNVSRVLKERINAAHRGRDT